MVLFIFVSNIHIHIRERAHIIKYINKIMIFPHTGPKVPHSRPAPKRKYGIFGLDVRKNSIRSTGVKLDSPQLVLATLAFGLAVTRAADCPSFFLPRCVIYY